ncbi:MAG: DNA internalization-related competence protein ComEC/Rec2 [Clostridia bacterium]|nr:DNA internalization-related competence protein ComEC/Rec2 [Clostridia bacterium]
MKHPFLYIAVSYALGVYLSTVIGFNFLLIFSISAILVFVVKSLLTRKINWHIPILISVFIISGFSFLYRSSCETSPAYPFIDNYVTVTGRICEIPSKKPENDYYTYVVKTKKLIYDKKTYTVKEKLQINTPKKYPYGSVIEASGFLSEFSDKQSEGSFDSKRYFKSKGISFKIFAYEGYSFLIQEKTMPSSLYDISNRLKAKSCEIIDKTFAGDNGAILKAILTGSKTSMSSELSRQMLNSGTGRLLHAPYLGILLLLWISSAIMAKFNISRNTRDITIIFLLVIFIEINQNSAVFVKGALLFIVYLIYTKKYGFLYIPDALPLSVLLMIIANPLYLYDAGFILSVCATVLLFIFKPLALPHFYFIKNPFIKRMVCTWLILTIGLMPLCAYFFNGTSFYSIILWIVLVPVILLVMILLPIMLLLFAIFGHAPVLYQAVYFSIEYIKFGAKLVSKFPLSYISLPAPSLTELLLFGLILIIIRDVLEKRLAYFRIFAASVCIFLILISKISEIGNINTTFVNVGQGDAAVIWVPYRETILIDGGGSAAYQTYNIGENVFVPYLSYHGLSHIDIAIVTHYHKDHCEGIVAAINNLKVNKLFLPDCEPENEYRLLLEEAACTHKTQIIYVKENTQIKYKSGLVLTIFPSVPIYDNSEDLNETSMVVDVKYGDFDAIITGDIGASIEKKLIDENLLHEYDVLKVAHHGSAASSSEGFLKITSPEYAVISVGENNSYGLPSPQVLSRLENCGTTVLRTDVFGDITITATKKGLFHIHYFKDGD